MKPNFDAMTKFELRGCIIAHPKNQEAFHAFVASFTPRSVCFTADASSVTYD